MIFGKGYSKAYDYLYSDKNYGKESLLSKLPKS